MASLFLVGLLSSCREGVSESFVDEVISCQCVMGWNSWIFIDADCVMLITHGNFIFYFADICGKEQRKWGICGKEQRKWGICGKEQRKWGICGKEQRKQGICGNKQRKQG